MFRFFKCNILGGFRLADLNRKVQQGEFFYVDAHICETSRSVKAALLHKWMTEVTADEASEHIIIPSSAVPSGVRNVETNLRKLDMNIATPHAKETTKKIESRQTERALRKQPMQKQKDEDKPIVPNFNKAEQRMRERQADVTTKGNDEVLPSPIKIKEDKKEKVVVVPESLSVVKDLVKDISVDNSMLATPNFDERKKEAEKQINNKTKKIIRRRKKIEPTN